jgi:O-antigen ligase
MRYAEARPLSRPLPLRAAAFLAGFAILVVVAFADGGYFRDTWVWLTLALAFLVWIALVLRMTITLSRVDIAAVVALAAFAGWVAVSATWSLTPEESLIEGERALLYVAALLAFVVLVERSVLREHLAGVATAAVLVAVFALGDRLVRGQREPDPLQGTLLFEPLGYANALAIFVVLGLLVSLGLALTAHGRGDRAVWIAASIVLVPALIWTDSRAAWLALLVGLGVLAVSTRRALAVAAAAALGSLLAIAALRADAALGSRADYWRVALDQWEDNAWLGAGAGTFAQFWQREPFSETVLDAHSLYLESLAELGPVGLALLACALAIPLAAAVRARHNPLARIAAAAYVAFLFHAGLDWDWEMPAVALAGLLVAVAALAAYRDAALEITLGTRGRATIALAALAIAVLAVAGRLAY